MSLSNSNPTLTHVTIANNTTNQYLGGGMILSNSNPILTHVTISNNTANGSGAGSAYGGGVYLSSSNPTLTHVTISNNTADSGGGMRLSNSDPMLTNSIIWDNSPESIDIFPHGTPIINFSNIEGGWEGEGNIDTAPLFTDPENGDYTLMEGSPCIDAGTADLDGDGEDDIEYVGAAPDMGAFEYGALVNVDETKVVPESFTLHQNYPNPFNPTTILRYNLPEQTEVTLTVYDMLGRQVKTLINNTQTAGYKSTQWNATNNTGQPVSAGLYLYTIQAGEFRQTKKMVLLK
jgi:hypothetical protein